jgi:poly(A) polymerase
MHVPAFAYLSQLVGLTSRRLYLVGGTIRDLLIGAKDVKDVDLLMQKGSEEVSRTFADRIGGSFFYLDETRKITRVVKHARGGGLQFDFTNFEGADLAADLGRRDFTINAMAVELPGFLESRSLENLIDFFGGRGDVEKRRIRAVSPGVLDDDPLRLLRAVRFAATLGFTIDPATAEEIRSRAGRVTLPAAERIRDELFQTLSVPGAEKYLQLLDSLDLLRRLLPELGPLKDFAPGKHHLYDILTHSLRTTGYVDGVLEDLSGIAPGHAATVRTHLDEELEPFVTRKAALRFACLLHDNAKSETYSRDEEGNIHFYGHDSLGADRALLVCRRFRLSGETASIVSRLVRHHMRPHNLSMSPAPTKRALYRYCRDLKDALPESIILALADARATAEVMPAEGFMDTHRTAARILEYYYERFLRTEARPFVTGRDLIAQGMHPGPGFREILDDIRELQAEGSLRDREEALEHLATIVKAR